MADNDIPTLSTQLQHLADYVTIGLVYSNDVAANKLANTKVGPDRMGTILRIRKLWIIPNIDGFTDSSKILKIKQPGQQSQQTIDDIARTLRDAGLLEVDLG